MIVLLCVVGLNCMPDLARALEAVPVLGPVIRIADLRTYHLHWGDTSISGELPVLEDAAEAVPSVETEGSARKEDTYCLLEENGYVVVYLGDRETVYDYTSIEVASLPPGLQHEIKNGKYVGSIQMLYSFLENYSS